MPTFAISPRRTSSLSIISAAALLVDNGTRCKRPSASVYWPYHFFVLQSLPVFLSV